MYEQPEQQKQQHVVPQLPPEVQAALDRIGAKVRWVTPMQAVDILKEKLALADRAGIYLSGQYRRTNQRFWMSVACNVVLLAVIWWKF